MKKSISIIGCGWLGLPLAKHCIQQGWQVNGSTTTPAKLSPLQALGIKPYLINLNQTPPCTDASLWQAETAVVNIPPGLRHQTATDYLQQLQNLVACLKNGGVKRVVFVSTTGIYADNNTDVVNTNDADTDSVFYTAEQLFLQCTDFETHIVRFAGLIGPNRHPARWFAGKTNIANGQAKVNLIHLNDCIGVITLLLQTPGNLTLHAAAPSHPTRAEFYTLAAKTAGLHLPSFIDELTECKTINPQLLVEQLHYSFTYPDLLDCLQQPDAF